MPRPTQTTLYWDCETRSTVNLKTAGVYVYASDPTTSVTVARLALGDEEPVEWRPGQELPARFAAAFRDHHVRIIAHNAGFERAILREILHPRHGWPDVPLWRWGCTMARARIQALPGSLDKAANALGLDVRKDGAGHNLMMRMCKPRAVAEDGTLTWWDDEDRMGRLSDYCAMDTKVERALDWALQDYSQSEKDVWDQTEVMNDRGVRFDLSFVAVARQVASDTRDLLDREMDVITKGRVVRASMVQELKRWLVARGVDLTPPPMVGVGAEDEGEADDVEEEAETKLPDMRTRDVIRLLADPRVGPYEKKALRVRLEAGKISVRKLDAITLRCDACGVVRGLLGYHGANTGRYISHGVQIQNFPRQVVANWDEARDTLDYGARMVDALHGPPLDLLSRMLRGSIIPRDGYEIAAGDYSSVEAVGVAWLAGQEDLLDAFRRPDAKIYEDMAGRVFNLAPSTIAPDSWQRHVGKTLVLGAGYQMGWQKFRQTVLNMGGVLLEPAMAERAINVYRETYDRIPMLWRAMQEAATVAVQKPGAVVAIDSGPPDSQVMFRVAGQWLRMKLPSGRYLWYNQPLLEQSDFGRQITYMQVKGPGQRKKGEPEWSRGSTYGGRLTENAVQGLCRDLLVSATLDLEDAEYRPIALVHDEIICEPRRGYGSLGEMLEIMTQLPSWAAGFPLKAKGSRGPRYVK